MMQPAAIHATVSNLIIEHYDYSFTSEGEPVIHIKVSNNSTEVLTGDLSVQVDRAFNTNQDEWGYKHVGNAISVHDVVLKPGRDQNLEIQNAPALKSGDYRANIQFQHLKESKQDQIDFSITQSDVSQSGWEDFHSHSSSSHRTQLLKYKSITIASLIIITGAFVRLFREKS
ncbi:hypothetical protein [Paenibacillus sp. YAF4_2]|uniref:hypothetical protein n=1 Tax=Paenibacillus sp. YAF4_2 TaxID=3233085 RepID=UPI003F9CD3A3